MNTETYPFRIGHHRCFVVNDDAVAWTAENLIGAATTQEQLAQLAHDFALDLDNIPTSITCLLVSTDRRNVLIDAGSGKRPYPGWNEGKTLQNLDSLGFDPGDIDDIIITHSDYDHIGGILDRDGRPEFPNAHYYLSANSWEYWSSSEGRSRIAALHDWPGDRIDYVWETYSTVRDHLTIVDYDVEFLPGFRMYSAIGHRYDQDVLKIESSDQKLIHLADTLLHPLMMGNRALYYSFDIEPEQAIETKERLLEWCVSEKALVFATHFPFPGLGTIQRRDNQWQWHPVTA